MATEKQAGLVLDYPHDNLAATDLYDPGNGEGEVDIPLQTVLAYDHLELSRESNRVLQCSTYLT